MTKRAKRLAKYLETDLGWSVFSDKTICPTCGNACYGKKYCSECGTKQVKPIKDRKETLDQIEQALIYALDES